MQHLEYKLFAGGYYRDIYYKDEYFKNITPFNKDLDTYSLKEALNLPFIRGFEDYFKASYNKDLNSSSFNEIKNCLIDFASKNNDAGLLYFPSEKEAEDYKEKSIKDLLEAETLTRFIGTFEDEFDNIKRIYELIPCYER